VTGDPRGRAARRYQDLLIGFRAVLGRLVNTAEDTLLRTAASLALRGEIMAASMACGERVDPAELTQLASELRRVLGILGLAGASAEAAELPTLGELADKVIRDARRQ